MQVAERILASVMADQSGSAVSGPTGLLKFKSADPIWLPRVTRSVTCQR
jgi:hypothetical protein